jgi:hypothetical protein
MSIIGGYRQVGTIAKASLSASESESKSKEVSEVL